jgi:hypothetical protein
MKKLFIATLITVSIATSAFADPTTVNRKVLTHFTNEFTDAKNVNWKVTSQFVEAIFLIEGKKMQAFYNTDGDIIGRSQSFAFNKLPKPALKEIIKKYPFPTYQLQECILFTNCEGDNKYFVSFNTAKEKLVFEISVLGGINEFKRTLL